MFTYVCLDQAIGERIESNDVYGLLNNTPNCNFPEIRFLLGVYFGCLTCSVCLHGHFDAMKLWLQFMIY